MNKNSVMVLIAFICSYGYSQTISIDTSVKYQVIDGFGGYTTKLKTGYDNFLLHAVDNMGMTILRQWVEVDGVSDTNQIKNGTFTFNEPSDYSNYYKAIKQKGVSTLVATCWSPPSCLKKNNSQCDQGCAPGCVPNTQPCYTDTNNIIYPDQRDLFARYIAAWAREFQTKATQKLHAISIQNEPMYSGNYSSAYLYSYNYGPLLKAVHDTFAADTALKDILFFGPEQMAAYSVNTGGSGGNDNRTKYLKDILENPAYAPLLDIYASHCYPVQSYIRGSESSWNLMSQAIIDTHKKPYWMSEVFFEEALDWKLVCIPMLQNMFASLKNGRVSAWLYWTINNDGGMWVPNSPIKRLYACKHFMRFVRPGYQQIQCNTSDNEVAAIAFKKNNNITVVLANWSTYQTKNISIPAFPGKPDSYQVYRSSNSESCAYAGQISGDSIAIKPQEIVTLYFNEQEINYIWSPMPPPSINVENIADNSIAVSWSSPAAWVLHGSKDSLTIPVTGYNVYLNGIKINPGAPITALTYTIVNLKPGTKYTIEVRARDSIFNESYAATTYVTTTCSAGNCTAIIDNRNVGFSISPSPADEGFYIHRDKPGQAEAVVTGIDGRVLHRQLIVGEMEWIPADNLVPGCYFVSLVSTSGTESELIIISR